MKTPRVQEVCQRIWDLRAECYYAGRTSALGSRDLARELGAAVGEDVREHAQYDWTQDTRVAWGMKVLRRAGLGMEPKADAFVEATVGMLLERDEELVMCGRDRAAGGGRSAE